MLGTAFELTAKPLADTNPGVRLGLYFPQNDEKFVFGYLHQYRHLSPEEIIERERRIFSEASSGLLAVEATMKPYSSITSSLGDQTFEYLMPVIHNDQLIAVAWQMNWCTRFLHKVENLV
ncbi:hypothetical protein N752_02830 [Desulforamulus aquiferis]|nr:hypothetical protein [Desulforamulus aquiferis]RYD06621.1 hypothetical protein N752_02830 [Desulforamulus aquiferis]